MLEMIWSKLRPGSFQFLLPLLHERVSQSLLFYQYCLNYWSPFVILVEKKSKISLASTSLFFCSLLCTALWFHKMPISLSSDIETNLGLAWRNQNKSFSISYCIIPAHSYAKMTLLKSCITAYKMDVTCLSETHLGSRTKLDDDNLEVLGYNLFLSDHLLNNKRRGVCIYNKTSILRSL